MMNYSFKQQQKTSGYNSIPHASGADEDTTAAVPFFGASQWRVILVAGALLLLVSGGGTVWRLQEGATTAAEGLVVATTECIETCEPATGTFGGVSTTKWKGSESHPFQTCFRLDELQVYCWTSSSCDKLRNHYPCAPDGWAFTHDDDDVTTGWHPVKNDHMQYNNPVTHPYFCGTPCQDVQAYVS